MTGMGAHFFSHFNHYNITILSILINNTYDDNNNILITLIKNLPPVEVPSFLVGVVIIIEAEGSVAQVSI